MYERLVYVSRAAPGVGARECYDIIRVAHNRNSQHRLTGALLFLDGHFVQLLEGEGWRLRDRLAVIAADPRHQDLVLRQSLATDQLLFADDWMALRHEAEIPPGLRTAHGLVHGWPATLTDGERLAAFVLACCRRGPAAAAQVSAGPASSGIAPSESWPSRPVAV